MHIQPDRMVRNGLLAVFLATGIVSAGFDQVRSRDVDRFQVRAPKAFRQDKDVLSVIMREGIPRGGGYTYQYPRENPEPFMTDKYAKQGDLSMEIELIASDYSGVAVCVAGSVDAIPFYEDAVLEFWIKGAQGGENALFVLVDDGVKSNGESFQVKMRSKGLGEITTDWKQFSIPLKLFGETGVYWDVKNQSEVLGKFAWSNVKGFRIEVRKDENTSFKVWIDDVVIKKAGQEYMGPSSYPFRNEL